VLVLGVARSFLYDEVNGAGCGENRCYVRDGLPDNPCTTCTDSVDTAICRAPKRMGRPGQILDSGTSNMLIPIRSALSSSERY
jgi:hypothetical protein